MLRFGLCCQFAQEPIAFRTTTATAVRKLTRQAALRKFGDVCRHNAAALLDAVTYCAAHGIGCFRVSSAILPLKTHPEVGYDFAELPEQAEIRQLFETCGQVAQAQNLRLTFHPDQFVVLNSPRPEVRQAAVAELRYQTELAAWIGADVITVHGGGAYGDKASALQTLRREVTALSGEIRSRLTLENDDTVYTPADILPVCEATGVPLVYDVHHHRCNPDHLSIADATARALATWDREPLFHISSPLEGWRGRHPRRHHDYIDIHDFPSLWLDLDLTVEVEAKAKELAVARLQQDLQSARALSLAPTATETRP